MSLDHGVASIAYCAIACAVLCFFVFRKTRERKNVFMAIVFSVGFYAWFMKWYTKSRHPSKII